MSCEKHQLVNDFLDLFRLRLADAKFCVYWIKALDWKKPAAFLSHYIGKLAIMPLF
jgi:hypothetical protein